MLSSHPSSKIHTHRKPLRTGVGSRKTFNGATFAEDIEVEEFDFRDTLNQATQERVDFVKGLVSVKEYETHTECLCVDVF